MRMAALAASLPIVAACGGAPDDPCAGAAPQQLDVLYAKYFRAGVITGCSASGCHEPGSRQINDGFTFASAHEMWQKSLGLQPLESSLPYVKPGDPNGSYLFRKLLPGIVDRMPRGGPYFTQAQLDEIRGWICAGAPEPPQQ